MPEPTGTSADRVAARLAEIRAQIERSRRAADLYGYAMAVGEQLAMSLDVPPLLAVAEAVLKMHAPTDEPVTSYTLCPDHARLDTVRELREKDMRDEIAACPDCLKDARYACKRCRRTCPDDDTWPCPEYRDITSALLGKEATDG